MKRFALTACALLLATASTGCCCRHYSGGACRPAPAPSPCGPCGAAPYGGVSYTQAVQPAFGGPAGFGAPAPIAAPAGGCASCGPGF